MTVVSATVGVAVVSIMGVVSATMGVAVVSIVRAMMLMIRFGSYHVGSVMLSVVVASVYIPGWRQLQSVSLASPGMQR